MGEDRISSEGRCTNLFADSGWRKMNEYLVPLRN